MSGLAAFAASCWVVIGCHGRPAGEGSAADTEGADAVPNNADAESAGEGDCDGECNGGGDCDGNGDGDGGNADSAIFEPWSTEGQRIFDTEGRERILHGINLSNDVKLPPYDSWAMGEDYARLQTWGFSFIRMLTAWASIEPQRRRYSETYLQKLDQRVAWAREHNLLVILDMHQDVYGEGFIGFNGAPRWTCDESLYASFTPMQPWSVNYLHPAVQECFRRFWANNDDLQGDFIQAMLVLADRYANEPAVIGFDLFNEPNCPDIGTMDECHRDQMQPFYDRAIQALELVRPGSLYFIEPVTWTSIGYVPPFATFPEQRVIYETHYYLPSVADSTLGYDGNPAPLDAAFGWYNDEALTLGVPWFLGEWGGMTDAPGFDPYLRDILRRLETYRVGWAYYDFMPDSDGYAPLDNDRSEKTEVVDRLARPYPKATAGELIAYEYDDRRHMFTMSFRNRANVTAPTIIALPERHYLGGFVVECSDPAGSWSYVHDAAAAEVRVRVNPMLKEHTITIHRP